MSFRQAVLLTMVTVAVIPLPAAAAPPGQTIKTGIFKFIGARPGQIVEFKTRQADGQTFLTALKPTGALAASRPASRPRTEVLSSE